MHIILSQRIDFKSEYDDEPYKTYHFPVRYHNQINIGDIFIYYQGDRYKKENRYYFGTGIIGEIKTEDGQNYYAKIDSGYKFVNRVPIYEVGGGYIESEGYESVRYHKNPPWQSSIRPISDEAFSKIIKLSGGKSAEYINGTVKQEGDLEFLKDKLKKAVKSFYIGSDDKAILSVITCAEEIAIYKNLMTDKMILKNDIEK